MAQKVAVLPGDGIGPEIVAEAVNILAWLRDTQGLSFDMVEATVGGAAYDLSGSPLPEQTLQLARDADAVLLGAVGGPKWESLPHALRPERGLLGLRKELDLFANLRPAMVYPQLVDASPLKPELVSGIDILVIRELTGDIYFGQPRGIETLPDGSRRGVNTMVYSEAEITRIAHVGFKAAQRRRKQLCSVDKANVLETTELWREVVTEIGQRDYPDVALTHMYVDNAAMQLIRQPRQFDVILTGNIFGDILSDEASQLTGSIGMLPSASLGDRYAMYEPIHGSAPDIAGKDIANPIATILSVAMMLRYSLGQSAWADRIEAAVNRVLDQGLRTADIAVAGSQRVGTQAMGAAILQALQEGLE